MSFSIVFGNFLYNNLFFLYRPIYTIFKNNQDAFEISLLKKYITKNATVIDIGANIGFYANILANCVGHNGKVHCFEPDEKNFNHLKNTTFNSPNIIIHQLAVSSKTEVLNFYLSNEINVDHRAYKPESYKAIKAVNAISIDDYVVKNNINKIDFIKIDIQGFEMQALKGMEQTLLKNKDVIVISEFWPYGLKTAGSSVNTYFETLTALGFNIHLLKKNELSPLTIEMVNQMKDLGKEYYFNILATRNDV
ncbi:MAG: FkbM family methyltransferase [Bacteroidetes bacterium]|nr:FkbM family methyltransferase [Bacteroidota bacterium]